MGFADSDPVGQQPFVDEPILGGPENPIHVVPVLDQPQLINEVHEINQQPVIQPDEMHGQEDVGHGDNMAIVPFQVAAVP